MILFPEVSYSKALEDAGLKTLFHRREELCSSRRGVLIVSALDSGSSGPGSGPGRGHCVVFLGKTLYSHGASLHPGV